MFSKTVAPNIIGERLNLFPQSIHIKNLFKSQLVRPETIEKKRKRQPIGFLQKLPFRGLWFQLSLKFELQRLVTPLIFGWFCKILVSKIHLKSQEKDNLTKCRFNVSLFFSITILRTTYSTYCYLRVLWCRVVIH